MSKLITKDQQEAYCLAWKQSNLTKTVFCKQNNISVSGLYTWLKRSNNNPTKSTVVSSNNNNTNNTQASDAIKFLQINNHNSINLNHDYCARATSH